MTLMLSIKLMQLIIKHTPKIHMSNNITNKLKLNAKLRLELLHLIFHSLTRKVKSVHFHH